MFLCYFSNVFRPKLPVTFTTYFGYHFGIENILQVLELQGKLLRHLHGSTGSVLLFVIGKATVYTIVILRTTHPSKENMLRFLFGKFYLIHFSIKTVIMGTQSIEHRPYHFKIGMLAQYLITFYIFRYHYRNNDVAVFLAGTATHHTSDGLHHINLGVFGWNENNRIQRRHINPLTQTTGICQHTAFHFIVRLPFKPHQFLVTFCGRHRTIHMFSYNIYHLSLVFRTNIFHIGRLAVSKNTCRCFWGFDCRTESYRTAHWQRVCRLDKPLISQYPFRQSVNATYKFGSIIYGYRAVFVGNYIAQSWSNILVAYGKNQYFIISKQLFLYGFAKTYAINLVTIQGNIIHRAQYNIAFFGFFACLIRIKTWGSSHIKPMFRLNKIIVVHFNKGTFFCSFKRYACRAVSLIANNQVENAVFTFRAF